MPAGGTRSGSGLKWQTHQLAKCQFTQLAIEVFPKIIWVVRTQMPLPCHKYSPFCLCRTEASEIVHPPYLGVHVA